MFFPLLSWLNNVLFSSSVIKSLVFLFGCKGEFAAINTEELSCLHIVKLFVSFVCYLDVEFY